MDWLSGFGFGFASAAFLSLWFYRSMIMDFWNAHNRLLTLIESFNKLLDKINESWNAASEDMGALINFYEEQCARKRKFKAHTSPNDVPPPPDKIA